LMDAAQRGAEGHAVAFCQEFSNRELKIGEGRVKFGRDGKRQRNELSFHCLRHTAVTLLKEAGVPQAVTMELIGHDSPEISQNYTHVGIEALKKAAAALPEV
jgi:integrase